MTRTEFLARLEAFKAYSVEHEAEIYSKPIKGNHVNSGAVGYTYEGEVKKYLGFMKSKLGYESNQRSDIYAGGLVMEVKHHCSPLDVFFSGKKIDYVAYCPDYMVNMNVNLCTYVLTRDGFLTVLEKAGLIRLKKGTDGIVRKAIQSYKNSKKKYALFLDLLDEYNVMTLEDYKALLEERKQARKAGRR